MARAESGARATPALPAVRLQRAACRQRPPVQIDPRGLGERYENITLAPARKEPHESGLSRNLLAMTSHNSGEAQGRLISPHSASGGLRRGRSAALRSAPIPHRELCDVMPSPEAGGRSRARPQYIPRCGLVTNALASWRVVLVAGSCGRPATMPRSPRKHQPLHVPVRWLLASSGNGAHPSRQSLRA